MNNKAFSLIEVIIAATILSITVFWVYKLIGENSKLIANKDVFVERNILLNDMKECIENIGFASFTWNAQAQYSFNFGPLNFSCVSDTYNSSYTFPSVDIAGKSYFIFGNILNKSSSSIDWELSVYEESSGKITKTYKQLP